MIVFDGSCADGRARMAVARRHVGPAPEADFAIWGEDTIGFAASTIVEACGQDFPARAVAGQRVPGDLDARIATQ